MQTPGRARKCKPSEPQAGPPEVDLQEAFAAIQAAFIDMAQAIKMVVKEILYGLTDE